MKRIVPFLLVVLVLMTVYISWVIYPKLDLISGFSAKSVASGHFIDNRPLELIEAQDNDIKLIDWATNTIEEAGKFATSSVYGLKERKAIYREGLGATLINDDFDETQPYLVPKRTESQKGLFPYGNTKPQDSLFSNVDYGNLNRAVANAFDASNEKVKRSRAVLVVYKDRIIAEKYAPGFNEKSKILGWSMTKSITGAMYGVLAQQGKYDIYKPAPIMQWQNDKRKNISTHNLLQMNSGLEWVEDYATICDATRMLFQAEDMGKVQLEKPLAHLPNTHWNYSSGTTNLLSKILRSQFNSHQEYLDFWYTNLIDKIGMHSMVIETDMVGNYVGSSYGWATARDWAKFGLLYLHQGNWNGEQILSSEWVIYTKTPTATSNGRYGAQFWLNAGGYFPDVPRDMYYCSGYQGQMVAVIPSKDMVIVRMGLKGEEGFDFNNFLKSIIATVQK
ncbi:serine hydrolase domain-containing protein [Flavobacterium faecale]|uniref:serine hydrolase domain-containing protein n=1 Tax=Flavobacterium faecale TaxID=1355330 RepID=UPI003AAE8E02